MAHELRQPADFEIGAGADDEVGAPHLGDQARLCLDHVHVLQRGRRDVDIELVAAEFVEQKSHAKAKGVFEAVQRDNPQHAAGPYGLARVALETNQPDEALRLLERCRTLEGADRYPLDYRAGQALLAKGDKAGAKVALDRVVHNKRSHPRHVDDAKKKLDELG